MHRFRNSNHHMPRHSGSRPLISGLPEISTLYAQVGNRPTWVAESPESSNQWQRLLDSGLTASRRPGMTSFTEGMTTLATESNPFRIAIVGSGPSGFYAAEALLRRPHVRIDMFDRLPTPFGLVRGGVAPDHPKIKQVCLVYDKIARSSGFAFLGNVE